VFSGLRGQQCREDDLRDVVLCLADLEVSSAETEMYHCKKQSDIDK